MSEWRYRDVVVLGIPPGGLVVASEVASALGAPLHALLMESVRSADTGSLLGVVASDGNVQLDHERLRWLLLDSTRLQSLVDESIQNLNLRRALFPTLNLKQLVSGKCVIVVDEEIATHHIAQAAVELLQRSGAAQTLVAAPCGAKSEIAKVRRQCEGVAILHQVPVYAGSAAYYGQLPDVSDEAAASLLNSRDGADWWHAVLDVRIAGLSWEAHRGPRDV